MPSRGFSLFIVLACIVVTGISCDNKKSAPVLKDKTLSNRIAVLFKEVEKYDNSNPDSLAFFAKQVVALAGKANDHKSIVRGERFIARALWRLGNHGQAMKISVGALKKAEKWGITSEIPDIYSLIGQLHKEKINYAMAFDAVDKGMVVSEKLKDTAAIIQLARMKAMFTQGMGANYKDTALIHKSLIMHLESVKMAESSPKFERSRIGYYNNIAQIYVKRKELDSAELYVYRAISLAKKYNQKSSLTYSYVWLAQIYDGRGDLKNSIFYRNKAVSIAKELKNPFREMELSDYLMEGYRSAGKYKEALDAFERYSTLRDSMQVLQNVRQVGELQLKYDDEKKDQQIGTLRQLNQLRSKQTIGALTLLCLFLVLSAVMFSQYRVIRQNNKILAENNRRINDQSDKMQFLMKELHHRVKNNLQIVSNLLSLQGNRLEDDSARRIIKAGQQRIETMSIIHKSLYSQDSSNMVNMREYVTNLLESIKQSFGTEDDQIDLNIIVGIQELDVDIAMPLGLIINEWITNSFKHAFRNVSKPLITLSLLEFTDYIQLEIKDNGPGFDLKKWDKPNGSFGIKLIKVLTRQLEAESRVVAGDGACFQLEIPVSVVNLALQ